MFLQHTPKIRRHLALLTMVSGVCLMVGGRVAYSAEWIPINVYADPNDSRFPEFGIQGALVIEDFEDGETNTVGLTLADIDNLTVGRSFIADRNSVRSDLEHGSGKSLSATPGACTATFPSQCPASVSFQFDDSAFGVLPTYVGFVWTDAVRENEADVHPWARINVIDAMGVSSATLINRLPIATSLSDEYTDDTLVSFINTEGIVRLDVTVMTNGASKIGGLSIDHVQYGIATLPGDTDLDGVVDFSDFLELSMAFGGDATWRSGDFNFDGQASFIDFLTMSENFGRRLPALKTAVQPAALTTVSSTTTSPVPEPSGWFLGGSAIGLTLWGYRKRRYAKVR